MVADNEETGKICPICGNSCTEVHSAESVMYNCIKCGKYKMNDFGNEPKLTEHHKLVLRHFYSVIPLGDKRRYDIIIDNDNIDKFVEGIDYPKTLIDKIDIVLTYFVKNTNYYGETVDIRDFYKISRILFCVKEKELWDIIRYLETQNFIKQEFKDTGKGNYQCHVEAKGFQYYQSTIIPKLKSTQCFVAMWFNETEDPERHILNMQNVYSVAIKPAIEFEDRFTSIKIDNVEHCNDINDEMISQIRKSRFMVADLTGYRGGVYWEAGFAEGLGIPVIYTCHEKWLNTDEDLNIEGVHFDLKHRNMILWNEENLEEFKQRLINRIGAIIV